MLHNQPVRHSVGLVIVLASAVGKICLNLFILYTSIALARFNYYHNMHTFISIINKGMHPSVTCY